MFVLPSFSRGFTRYRDTTRPREPRKRCVTPQRPGKLLNACVEIHIVQKCPLTGYVPDFSEYVLGPVPLPRPVPQGLSVQALGTFSMQLTNLELASPETHDAVVIELGIPRRALLYQGMLIEPLGRQGVTFEVVGTCIEPTDPPEAPRFTDGLSEAHSFTIIAWRRRVYHEESGFSLEIRWHPKTGEIIQTKHPRTLPLITADKHRAAALQLLQEVERRGRRSGPAGFKDTLLSLIQAAYGKSQDTTQGRIATLLRPVLVSRRGGIGSAASVDIDSDSTVRLIRKHLSCKWAELVKKALQST
jgi:hypothetical protein